MCLQNKLWSSRLRLSSKFSDQFPDLDTIFALKGEQVTRAKRRDVIRLSIENQVFYIKRYTRPGTGIRRFLGRSRLRAEWENLHYFASMGIPVPELVAYGERREGFFKKGAMVLREIPGVIPLNEVAQFSEFENKEWRKNIIKKIAHYTKSLHQQRFVHGDLYLRNILVNRQGDIFFIDCPQGKKRIWPILRYWKRKDLRCLHKEAKGLFSDEDIAYFLREYESTEHER